MRCCRTLPSWLRVRTSTMRQGPHTCITRNKNAPPSLRSWIESLMTITCGMSKQIQPFQRTHIASCPLHIRVKYLYTGHQNYWKGFGRPGPGLAIDMSLVTKFPDNFEYTTYVSLTITWTPSSSALPRLNSPFVSASPHLHAKAFNLLFLVSWSLHGASARAPVNLPTPGILLKNVFTFLAAAEWHATTIGNRIYVRKKD